jgi:hypothetical protein
MTYSDTDPAAQWSRHLSRLHGRLLHAVVEALRHSAASGVPASEEEVRLLVAYALGEITSRDYAAGVLAALGLADPAPRAAPAEVDLLDGGPFPDSSVPPAAGTADPGRTIRREDAVHAYVTGQIPVGEFLRIARG